MTVRPILRPGVARVRARRAVGSRRNGV